MTTLRQKLIASYGLLLIITFAVGVWSVYHLVRLGRAIDVILANNYQSIVAAGHMQESLAQLDAAALFWLAGERHRARQQMSENAAQFEQAYKAAAGNVTEAGEPEILDAIAAQYADYKAALERFGSEAGEAEEVVNGRAQSPAGVSATSVSRRYFAQLEPRLLALKNRLDELLALNQQAMLAANERAISQSWQAVASVAMLALFVLAVAGVYAWRFADAVTKPLGELAAKAKLIGEGDFEQRLNVQTKDEIGALAAAFNQMAARLRDLRQSQRWRLLLESKKSDAVIEALYEPVIVTDAQGRVTKVNKAAAELFRRSRDGAADEQDFSLSGLGAGDRILRAVRDAVALQKPVAQEGDAALVPMRLGDIERQYRLRATPVRDADGRLLGAVILLEDLTALKELDDLKSEFIALASRKLRDPLRALQIALYAVIEGHAGEVGEAQMAMLLEARQNAEQLDDIMNDLLELAEMESGGRQLTTERLRPVELARAAVERFQATADACHVKLVNQVWADLPWVIADRQAMRRVFDNLLSNALRHTPRDGAVTIAAEEQIDRVWFRVADTGAGIAEAVLPTLFHRFAPVGEATSGGTGLGLALVKRLIEAQGGQVGVESRVGEGTTFTFTLPVGAPSLARR